MGKDGYETYLRPPRTVQAADLLQLIEWKEQALREHPEAIRIEHVEWVVFNEPTAKAI